MEEDKLKVIIGDHIGWEIQAGYYKNMAEYYTFLHDVSKALLMGNDEVASAEINRVCDAFKNETIREDIRIEYLKKAAGLKPIDWPSYLPKI